MVVGQPRPAPIDRACAALGSLIEGYGTGNRLRNACASLRLSPESSPTNATLPAYAFDSAWKEPNSARQLGHPPKRFAAAPVHRDDRVNRICEPPVYRVFSSWPRSDAGRYRHKEDASCPD